MKPSFILVNASWEDSAGEEVRVGPQDPMIQIVLVPPGPAGLGCLAGGEARVVVRPPDPMTRTVLVPLGPAEMVTDAEARVGDPMTQSGPAVVPGSVGGGLGGW